MSDILLIGPQQGGKTAMIYSYQGIEVPGYMATGEKGMQCKSKGFLWTGWGGDEIKEIGGFKSFQDDKCIEAINSKYDRKIFFVFDGVEFIKQASHPEEGGEVWARWLYYCSQSKIQQRDVHFVATHNDCIEDMGNQIVECVRAANKKYESILGSGACRYDADCFEGPNFHCINAKNIKEVKQLFDKIRK